MGMLDFLFGGAPRKIDDPERLRSALAAAAEKGDMQTLQALCAGHQEIILTSFPGWARIPEAIRSDPDAVRRHANGLIAVAVHFAKELGHPELLQRLQGTPQDNPIVAWEADVKEAEGRMERGEFEEAYRLLEKRLAAGRTLQGTGVDAWRPVTQGLMAVCRFSVGDAQAALGPAEDAQAGFHAIQRPEGVRRYLELAFDVQRYLGRPAEAAACAGRLADDAQSSGRTEEAVRWRDVARIVAAGEPLNRVVVRIGERVSEVEQAPAVRDGRVEFLFERNRPSLGRTGFLLREGMDHGARGDYAAALTSFRAAAAADPFDPQPHHQAGVTQLHLRRAADAVESFRKAEELAPGWFQCRADLWLAQGIALGRIPESVFSALRELEDRDLRPADRAALARQALGAAPGTGALELALGSALLEAGEIQASEEALRRACAPSTEPDTRTRALLRLATVVSSGEEKRALLSEAAGLRGNLVAAAQAAYFLRHGLPG